ncbi:MAG: tRNA (adenosine(37)-N6)-threonylcarbamoyltransferase complex ATPase subunit type 1 TsaE [Chloroflexota bacterium]
MPIIREGELDIISHSAEQTARLGARLGKLLRPGDVVCLAGDMGAGKTVFSAGVGRGWGATHALTSPTYTLVHEHRRDDGAKLYHLDCYRLQNADEADSIGIDDILDSGSVMLIEWAERIAEILPDEKLWIELRVIESTRRNLMLDGTGTRYETLVKEFRAQTFGVK